MRRSLAFAWLLVLGLVACGASDTGRPRERAGSIPPGANAGPDEIVFRVDTRGGFTPYEYQLRLVPAVSVETGGRVIVTGPVTQQYPLHALPNLVTGHLPDHEMQALNELAARLGLLRRVDYGRPAISDAPTTTVTIEVDGHHEQTAYALDLAGDVGAPGLTAAQRDARQRLRRFTTTLTDAANRAATEPYEATEVAVFVRPASAHDDGNGVEAGRADWPLGNLATIGSPHPAGPGADPVYRCAVLTGADARIAFAAAVDATSITQWRSNGRDYTIVWRPLLPDEHACPEAP